MRTRLTLTTLLLALPPAACGGSDTGSDGSSEDGGSSSSAPNLADPNFSQGPGSASCDLSADAAVTLEQTGDGMVVTFARLAPEQGTFRELRVTANGPYATGLQNSGTDVTIIYDGTKLDTYTYLPKDDSYKNKPLSGEPEVRGDDVVATVPFSDDMNMVKGIAYWTASAFVDQKEVATQDVDDPCLVDGSMREFYKG